MAPVLWHPRQTTLSSGESATPDTKAMCGGLRPGQRRVGLQVRGLGRQLAALARVVGRVTLETRDTTDVERQLVRIRRSRRERNGKQHSDRTQGRHFP